MSEAHATNPDRGASETPAVEFYDTHAHLDFPDFQEDLPQVIERARAARITRILAVGIDEASSRRALALSEQYPEVFAVIGWHPNEAAHAPDDVRPMLRELAQNPKVVAIGEIGLDYYRLPGCCEGKPSEADDAIKARQADLFAQQLELAAALGLNVVVHERSAFDEVVAQVRPFADRVRAVFHCFSRGPEAVEQVLALNGLVSYTGVLTFKNAPVVREGLAAAPLDRFMLETDCPFLAPVPRRGKRCEPADVQHIARVAAQVKQCSLEMLSRVTCETARRFFPRIGG